MAKTSDAYLNYRLDLIETTEFGKDIREPISSAIYRCYQLGVRKAGSPKNGVTSAKLDEHLQRIMFAVYGEEVRDAIATAITLCYRARGIDISDSETARLNSLANARKGSDLRDAIGNVIIRCYEDVK